jgi:hypothetical protein
MFDRLVEDFCQFDEYSWRPRYGELMSILKMTLRAGAGLRGEFPIRFTTTLSFRVSPLQA